MAASAGFELANTHDHSWLHRRVVVGMMDHACARELVRQEMRMVEALTGNPHADFAKSAEALRSVRTRWVDTFPHLCPDPGAAAPPSESDARADLIEKFRKYSQKVLGKVGNGE
jgi:hypothetical protein